MPHIVFDGYSAPAVLQVLLHHGKTRARSTYVSFHAAVCRCHTEIESSFLVRDARSLIGKSDGVSVIEYRDNGFSKMGVDKVFNNFSDDHQRYAAALLLHATIYRVGDFFEVRADVRGLDHDDARRRQHVIVDGYTRGVHGGLGSRAGYVLFGGGMDLGRSFLDTGEVSVVRSGVAGVYKGIKVFRHGFAIGRNSSFSIVAHATSFRSFPQLFKTC